jgi:hypothetical protein
MKTYNLFLDDKRDPKDVFSYISDPIYKEDWVVVRSYDEFLHKISEMYANGYLPTVVSFDHDLVSEHYRIGVMSGFMSFDENSVRTPTGWHCLQWLLKFCDTNDIKLPKILFHSMNAGGIVNMKALLDEYVFNKNKEK